MSASSTLRPVRRGALDHVHERLGARWAPDGSRWPASYGDPAGELAAATRAVALAEIGPLDKLTVKGQATRAALSDARLSHEAGRVRKAKGIEVWGLAADEAILLWPAGVAGSGKLAARLRVPGAAVTDLSSGLAVLRLVGPAARSVLEEATAVDLGERAVADRGVVQASVANVVVTLARQDMPAGPGFTILVARDLAEYLWEALLELGSPHGITPAGTEAVG